MSNHEPERPAEGNPRFPAPAGPALSELVRALPEAAGGNFHGLILYGGLARGRYRPGTSDVNVVVVLESGTRPALALIAPPLRAAWRSARVSPFILSREEIPAAADVFPVKFLDIQHRHILLAGADPFSGLTIPVENIRLRVEQEFRNLEMRLRERYVAVFDDPVAQAAILTRTAHSLAIGFRTLLWLSGHDPAGAASGDDDARAVFTDAATAFGLDAACLAQLASLDASGSNLEDADALYDSTLALLDHTTGIVDRLEVKVG